MPRGKSLHGIADRAEAIDGIHLLSVKDMKIFLSRGYSAMTHQFRFRLYVDSVVKHIDCKGMASAVP